MQPNVLGIGSLNERLCEWLDNLLKPLVNGIPGYIEDSGVEDGISGVGR